MFYCLLSLNITGGVRWWWRENWRMLSRTGMRAQRSEYLGTFQNSYLHPPPHWQSYLLKYSVHLPAVCLCQLKPFSVLILNNTTSCVCEVSVGHCVCLLRSALRLVLCWGKTEVRGHESTGNSSEETETCGRSLFPSLRPEQRLPHPTFILFLDQCTNVMIGLCVCMYVRVCDAFIVFHTQWDDKMLPVCQCVKWSRINETDAVWTI